MVHLPPSSSPREAPRLLGLGLQLLGQPGHRHRGADRTSSGREPQPRQPVTTARPSGGATPGRPIRRKPPQVGPLQAAPAGPTRTARASAGAGDRDAPPTTSIRSIKSTRPEPWKGARRRPCRRAAKRAKRPSWRCSCRSISVKQRMRYLTSAVGAGAGTRRAGRRLTVASPRLRCATGSIWGDCCIHPAEPDRRGGAGVGTSLELSTRDHSRPGAGHDAAAAHHRRCRASRVSAPRRPATDRPESTSRCWSSDRADRMRPSGSPARGSADLTGWAEGRRGWVERGRRR